jgi:histidine triad (HIT) family protein
MEPHKISPEEDVFDKIIRREIPADIVYEDEETLAFLDIKPNHPGHTLVVSKKYFRNIFDMDEATLNSVMKTTQKMAIAIREALHADGINIAMNNEAGAGQVVFHAHVHVIPRFNGDGFQFFPHADLDPAVGAIVAEKIRAQLA